MSTWRTMTPGGLRGNDYEAGTEDDAVRMAEQDGYHVLDTWNGPDGSILIIAG